MMFTPPKLMVSAVFAKLKEIATMTGSAVSSTLDFNPFGNKVIHTNVQHTLEPKHSNMYSKRTKAYYYMQI